MPILTDCACGRPTRDNAYGCEDCADAFSRALGDVPWIVEELDITITGQRGKRPGVSGRATNGLPWNERASKVLHDLDDYLTATVLFCIANNIRHQSPHAGIPARTPEAMSRWLLWRVDGLTLHPDFGSILTGLDRIEERALKGIDRAPDRMFLGMCELAKFGVCDGAVYVTAGQTIGTCRSCGMEYDPEERRASLEKALDDRLCTAAEIARLSTYLGLTVERRRIQLIVAQWHKRGRISAAPQSDPNADPRFRYGDVAVRLAAAYAPNREAI